MRTNERFLEALTSMNNVVKADYASGKPWHYTNTKKRAKTFDAARKLNRLTNCVDAVQMGLRTAGVPASALDWYGGQGKIVWCSPNARAEALKYFDIIPTGGATVNSLYNNMKLADGDILLGYQKMSHTNCYIGGKRSFDAGASEGSVFKKWIFSLKWGRKKVNRILRLKDRAHYRVQAGAFNSMDEYNKTKAIIEKKGFATSMVIEDGMYKIQLGSFSGKTTADRFAAQVAAKGIGVFVKEL